MIKKMLVFDMDGTIADLYGVDNWLDLLRKEDVTPYKIAKPMLDMDELAQVLNELKKQGYVIAVTTWLAKNASNEYKKSIRETKKEWLEKYHFPYDTFHAVQYGECKRYVTSPRKIYSNGKYYPLEQILFDDSKDVRNDWEKWHGTAINPEEENLVEWLKNFLKERKEVR